MLFLFATLTACLPPMPDPAEQADATIKGERDLACADPTARARLGPFAVHALDDWSRQPENPAGHYASWGVSVADFDADGVNDIYLPTYGQDRLYLGRPGPWWQDVTEAMLPYEPGESSIGSAAADADGDGDLDLAVARSGPNALYLNTGGAFIRAEVPAFERYDEESRHVAWGDLDGDGLPELFFANHYSAESAAIPDPNELYHNAGDAEFEDISAMLGPMGLDTPANAGGFFDVDRDGDQDLYVVNDKPQSGFLSVLLENEGGELRYDHNARGLDLAIFGMGLGLGLLNEDRLPELVVTGWGEHAVMMSAPDGVWFNLADAALQADAARVVAWGVELVDLDLDADLDLVIAHGPEYDEHGDIAVPEDDPALQAIGVYINDGGVFVERSAEYGMDNLGVYRGLVVAELNGDGYPDILVRGLGAPSPIWLSRCGEGRALRVRLSAPGPDTFALGARVRVLADNLDIERVVYAGTTSISSSAPPELLFGLGEADKVAIEVTWPDGAVSRFEQVPARQRLVITRE